MCTYKEIANYVEQYEHEVHEYLKILHERMDAEDRLGDLPKHCSKADRQAAANHVAYLQQMEDACWHRGETLRQEVSRKYSVDIDDFVGSRFYKAYNA